MSHSHARLDEEHRCIAAKCKGRLHDDPKLYGRYAYWRRGKDGWAWYATPSRRRSAKRFPIAIISNPKNDQERRRGFTHRMIFEGGGFLFLHKDYVADEKRKLRERNKKSKRA